MSEQIGLGPSSVLGARRLLGRLIRGLTGATAVVSVREADRLGDLSEDGRDAAVMMGRRLEDLCLGSSGRPRFRGGRTILRRLFGRRRRRQVVRQLVQRLSEQSMVPIALFDEHGAVDQVGRQLVRAAGDRIAPRTRV